MSLTQSIAFIIFFGSSSQILIFFLPPHPFFSLLPPHTPHTMLYSSSSRQCPASSMSSCRPPLLVAEPISTSLATALAAHPPLVCRPFASTSLVATTVARLYHPCHHTSRLPSPATPRKAGSRLLASRSGQIWAVASESQPLPPSHSPPRWSLSWSPPPLRTWWQWPQHHLPAPLL